MDTLVSFLIAFFMLLGLIYDLSSILQKGVIIKENARELLAFSGLVQYMSRLFFLAATFLLVFSFESSVLEQLNGNLIALIVLGSSFVILPLLSIRYVWLVGIFSSPVRLVFFRGLKVHYQSLKVEGTCQVYVWRLVGLIMQLLLLSAIFMPVIVAQYFPEFRMSLSYLGQALNFGFTVVVLSVVEPSLFRSIDKFMHSRKDDDEFQGGIASEVTHMAFGKVLGCFVWGFGVLYFV